MTVDNIRTSWRYCRRHDTEQSGHRYERSASGTVDRNLHVQGLLQDGHIRTSVMCWCSCC